MKKKLPWLKYDMKKAEYMEAKEQEQDAKRKLDEAAKTLNELREPIEYDDLVYPIVQFLLYMQLSSILVNYRIVIYTNDMFYHMWSLTC